MIRIPHPIPYQGSKRWLAETICRCLPADVETLYEPFAGSAAVTLAAASAKLARWFVISDIHSPLAALWQAIIQQPEQLADQYEELWRKQAGDERAFYDTVRLRFNQTHEPGAFLYLLARCVKAAIRYNGRGEFNNSPDNRRRGAMPETMRFHVVGASRLLRGKVRVECADFRAATKDATSSDVIYMDPPYQGVSKERDSRYLRGLVFDDFCGAVAEMNRRGLSFIVSYDGRTGSRYYGKKLPDHLGLKHFEVLAGRSTQETLLGRAAITYESLYLSPALIDRIDRVPSSLARSSHESEQLELFQGAA